MVRCHQQQSHHRTLHSAAIKFTPNTYSSARRTSHVGHPLEPPNRKHQRCDPWCTRPNTSHERVPVPPHRRRRNRPDRRPRHHVRSTIKMARITDALINSSGTNYEHPARTTLAVIVVDMAICAVVGLIIALSLTSWITTPNRFTWVWYAAIAGATLSVQIGLAVFNSLVMVPIAVRISRRFMQRRYGILIDQNMVERVEMETEAPSKLGPAAVVAAATVVTLIQQDAPTWATIVLTVTAATLSPVGRHLTDHKDIVTLWRGARRTYYSVTTKRATKR